MFSTNPLAPGWLLVVQRRQQRKEAEERRSEHLQKIMQEAQAQHGPPPAARPQPTSSGNGYSEGNGRRRTVSFQSPSSGEVYGRGSPQGVAEMPAAADGQELEAANVPSVRHLTYGTGDALEVREEFDFADGVMEVREAWSMNPAW
jgi:hypothetical protein